uniref:Retrovirus-related Pol polyprotein from transposon TNT 1-94-like beta-barrel domain-containing protein n=1 Tax=Cannabis sativa TaxID=3483 RepID=A0A803PZB6_CANSA
MVVHEERQSKLENPQLPLLASVQESTQPPTALAQNPSTSAASTNPRPNKKMRPYCSNCHKPSHLKEKYFFLISFPPGYGDKKKFDELSIHYASTSVDQYGGLANLSKQEDILAIISLLTQKLQPTPATDASKPFASHVSGKSSHNCLWIVDSGASHHICCDISLFSSMHKNTIAHTVTLPNGSTIRVHNSDDINISQDLSISNVLYVLTFQFNLFSVSSFFTNTSNNIHFTTDSCTVHGPQNKSIGTAKRIGNLYFLLQFANSPTSPFTTTKTPFRGGF